MATAAMLPVVDQAVHLLRRDIISAELAPGEKLKIRELNGAYGFSSSPLREALNQLSREGFVTADARRGFRVAPMSVEDFADITRMRLMIDVDSLGRAVDNGDDEWESTIVASYHRLEKIESRLGTKPATLDDEWARLHKAFHAALLAACDSEWALRFSSILFDQAERYRRLSARRRRRPRNKRDEHKAIMDATLARDKVTAQSLLHQHIELTKGHVSEIIRRSEPETSALGA